MNQNFATTSKQLTSSNFYRKYTLIAQGELFFYNYQHIEIINWILACIYIV